MSIRSSAVGRHARAHRPLGGQVPGRPQALGRDAGADGRAGTERRLADRRAHRRGREVPRHAAGVGLRGRHLLLDVQTCSRSAATTSPSAPTSAAGSTAPRTSSRTRRRSSAASSAKAPPDGRIFLKREEECLAACAGAPMMVVNGHYHEQLDAREGRRDPRRAGVTHGMATVTIHEPTGPVGPAPQEHNVVYTTLHFDKPWSYENYLKTGGYAALRKILDREDRRRRRDRHGQGLGPARPRRRRLPDRPEVELHAARRPGRSTSCATRTNPSRAPARTATSCATTRIR